MGICTAQTLEEREILQSGAWMFRIHILRQKYGVQGTDSNMPLSMSPVTKSGDIA